MLQLSQRLHATNVTLLQSLQHCCNLCNIAAISVTLLWLHVANATLLQQLQHCRDPIKKNLCLWLSEFLKIHREQEAGLKVCPKCFFMTLEQIFIILFFAYLMKKKWEGGLNCSQQNVFLHNNCEHIFFLPFSSRRNWEVRLILHSKMCFFQMKATWKQQESNPKKIWKFILQRNC